MLRPHFNSVVLPALGVAVSCLSGALLVAFHAPLSTQVRAEWIDGEKLAAQSIYHFAAEDCRCSEQLLAHLAARMPIDSADEVVVFLGKPKPSHQQLKLLGYEVRYDVTPEHSGVQAAPWLLVRDSGGRVVYSGGYERAPYWEARILFHVAHRVRQASLQTPGCATSRALRSDHLALRLKELLPRR